MNYVIAAYALTFALVGGYALTIVLRRRAVERELAAGLGSDDPDGAEPAAANAAVGEPAVAAQAGGEPSAHPQAEVDPP